MKEILVMQIAVMYLRVGISGSLLGQECRTLGATTSMFFHLQVS
jgi:hypothetical protein